jgi:CheY-like chemotaxis protein
MRILEPALRRLNSTVLVVDDDEAVRQYTARVRENEGYRALLAEDGKEALALLKRYMPRIHLVVTDVLLPRMTGPELAIRVALHRRSQQPDPPDIAKCDRYTLTGDGSLEFTSERLQAGRRLR